MPITIQYQPRAATVAGAAYQGGLGQYAKYLTELAYRDAEMAQREQMQARAIAAQQYSQRQAQAGDLFGRMLSMDMQERAWEKNRGAELADQQKQHDWQVEAAQTNRDWNWGVASADALNKEVGTMMSALAKQRTKMTPEGVKLYGDLAGKYRAITKQMGLVRPQQYAELLGQFQEELVNSGVNDHIQVPQTIEERLAQEMHEIERDGVKIGMGFDRNGAPREVYKITPKDREGTTSLPPLNTEQGKRWLDENTTEIPGIGLVQRDKGGKLTPVGKGTIPRSFEEAYANKEKFDKDFSAIEKHLYDQNVKEATSGLKEGEKPAPPEPPTDREVIEAMKRRFNAYQSAVGTTDILSVVQGSGVSGQGPAEQLPPLPPEAIAEILGHQPAMGDPGGPPPPPPNVAANRELAPPPPPPGMEQAGVPVTPVGTQSLPVRPEAVQLQALDAQLEEIDNLLRDSWFPWTKGEAQKAVDALGASLRELSDESFVEFANSRSASRGFVPRVSKAIDQEFTRRGWTKKDGLWRRPKDKAPNKQHEEVVDQLLPRPETPEKAVELGPGARFRKPDGSIGMVPYPSGG